MVAQEPAGQESSMHKQAMQPVRKVILDLDTGIDDALALAYAIAHPCLELIGVTCTFGNVTVPKSVRNTLGLLDLLGRSDIPVFAGPEHASDSESFAVSEGSAFIHGSGGLGGLTLPAPTRQPQAEEAVEFLLQKVRELGDELVIVPTGPSTTIAAAIDADPHFAAAAHLVMMGGALTVPGNVTSCAEANVFQDPRATNAVFAAAQDVTMVGLDVTLQTLLTKDTTRRWRQLGAPVAEFYADIVDYYIDAYATIAPELGGCGLHDPLAVAVAADPGIVTLLPRNLKVDTRGATRGRTIGDELRLGPGHSVTARAAVGVDVDRFLREFVGALTRLFARTGGN